MTKSFGTALACIAFTSYLNPIMPIAGELRALCLWGCCFVSSRHTTRPQAKYLPL